MIIDVHEYYVLKDEIRRLEAERNEARQWARKMMHTAFSILWDNLNAKRGYPWSVNPWVWVVEFEREAHQ